MGDTECRGPFGSSVTVRSLASLASSVGDAVSATLVNLVAIRPTALLATSVGDAVVRGSLRCFLTVRERAPAPKAPMVLAIVGVIADSGAAVGVV